MVFYAVANGRTTGIFLKWNDCNNSVKKYKNAIYKKFDTLEEADIFIKLNTNIINQNDNNINQNDNITLYCNNFNPDYYVYTDGACSNNGKIGAQAGIGIYFGENDIRNISKKIKDIQTNNTAELSAIIETYYIIENDIINGKKIIIVSDSEYAIKCISSYGNKCYNQQWNVNIPNKELVKLSYEMYKDKLNVKFIHIKSHTHNSDVHSIGNNNADKLAKLAIKK